MKTGIVNRQDVDVMNAFRFLYLREKAIGESGAFGCMDILCTVIIFVAGVG